MPAVAPAPSLSASRADLDHLQGVWTSVAGPCEARFLIAGTRYAFEFVGGDVYIGTFEIAPGQMDMSIDEGPENLDLTYRVVGADWTELAYWVAAYRKGGLTEGSVDFARPGTYYLEVRDASNDGRSIEPATLKTIFTPTPGSNEPCSSLTVPSMVPLMAVDCA